MQTVIDINKILGKKRYIVIAKEITKIWESIKGDYAENILNWLKYDKNRQKGEIVLLIEGYKKKNDYVIQTNIQKIIIELIKYIPKKKVISIINKIYGLKKNLIYNFIIKKNV